MFVIKRNQVVVTALAVMIAAAGYLNFRSGVGIFCGGKAKQGAISCKGEGHFDRNVEK